MRAQSILDSPLDLQHRESEIVDAVFQSEKSIRGAPVESYKLRYFNSFEFFDHTAFLPEICVFFEVLHGGLVALSKSLFSLVFMRVVAV